MAGVEAELSAPAATPPILLPYLAAVARRRSIAFVLPLVLCAVVVGSTAGPGRPATQPSPRASEYGIQIPQADPGRSRADSHAAVGQ